MKPALLVIGHGTKSAAGVAEFSALIDRVRSRAVEADIEGGFLELAPPPIQEAVVRLVEAGHRSIDVVPLVLVAAGHSKGDIPAAPLGTSATIGAPVRSAKSPCCRALSSATRSST